MTESELRNALSELEQLKSLCGTHTMQQIAEALGWTYPKVNRIMIQHGLKTIRQRNAKSAKLATDLIDYYRTHPSLRQCSEKFGISFQRVSQILHKSEVENKWLADIAERRERVAQIAAEHPLLTNIEIGQIAGISSEVTGNDLRFLGVKRDKHSILSRVNSVKMAKGRTILTKDILIKEYIENGLSQHEIAEKYGYAQSSIARKITLWGLQKTRDQVNTSIIKNYGRHTGAVRAGVER